MNLITIKLLNDKAYDLLLELEGKGHIKIVNITTNSVSSLRGRIKSPMTEEEIDVQLKKLRDEWQREF